ncbi:hypothetical protein [Streptomyces sp. DW26H14]|uniref:hypothetical protein n=1 Tax=Streptomyces sp. DW26H14 TaxID=3435395 RepID=UPI00403E2934
MEGDIDVALYQGRSAVMETTSGDVRTHVTSMASCRTQRILLRAENRAPPETGRPERPPRSSIDPRSMSRRPRGSRKGKSRVPPGRR